MYDVCCLVIFIVIVVVIVLALLSPKEQKVKVVQTPSPQVQKVYVKTCPKCGAENESGVKYCGTCGNKF